MKIPDCFEAYRILALLAAGLLLVGCDSGVSSGGGGARGCAQDLPEPTNFEESFDTFTISGNPQESPAGADLEKTLFRQFFKAVKPASGESQNAEDIYAFMSEETDSIAHFGDINNLPNYNSVRNDFDLIEAMISASGQFEQLQLARDAMASCARDTQQALSEGKDGLPGSARINKITVTEKAENDSQAETWSYFVNYAHNASPLDDTTPFGPNIARLVTGPTAVMFSLYELEEFTGNSAASGFKQPGKLIVGFNATVEETVSDNGTEEGSTDGQQNNQPSIFFESFPLKNTQDARGKERGETDRWEWSFSEGTEKFMVTNDEGDSVPARCVRVTRDYAGDSSQNQVKVELSAETCPKISEASEFQKDDEFSYTAANPSVSQTR